MTKTPLIFIDYDKIEKRLASIIFDRLLDKQPLSSVDLATFRREGALVEHYPLTRHPGIPDARYRKPRRR